MQNLLNSELFMSIPFEVERIIQVLESKGHQGYIVGGCVRDCIMGRIPNDWDITTDAEPLQLMDYFSCFEKVIPTGIKHGTVTVIVNSKSLEVTTFRVDGQYSDNRRPDSVIFTKTLREDLSRRDFTMNSMAYNIQTGLIDYFGGLRDVKKCEVRCVGNPDERFQEDALRMLRAVRFAAQLDFNINQEVKVAILGNSNLLENISMERINQEFSKIILTNPFCIKDLWELKLLHHIMPEFIECMITEQDNPHHIYNVGEHILRSMQSIEPTLHLRLTMLLHDIGKPKQKTIDKKGIGHFYGHQEVSFEMAKDILKRLKYDNDTIDKVSQLVLFHDERIVDDKKSIRKWLSRIGKDDLLDLIKVKEADSKSQNPKYYNERHIKLEKIKDSIQEIIEKDECVTVKDLKINGDDLMNLGYKQGKEIGVALKMLLEKVIEDPELNERKKLVKVATAMGCSNLRKIKNG